MMQVSQQNVQYLTPEDYLATERQGLDKHEYYQGECFAMAGASRWHNLLAGRVFSALLHHLEGESCTAYMSDMRLHIESHQNYVYPDVMVVCEEQAYIADDMVNDAGIIVEVLSSSTELYDRGTKFLHYQSLPSLREYVLISQKEVQIEIYRRKPDGKWEYERLTTTSDMLSFSTINCQCSLEDLYRSIPLKKTK